MEQTIEQQTSNELQVPRVEWEQSASRNQYFKEYNQKNWEKKLEYYKKWWQDHKDYFKSYYETVCKLKVSCDTCSK